VGWLVMVARRTPKPSGMSLLAWGLLFAVFLAATGVIQDMRDGFATKGASFTETTVELPRAPDGHYYVTIDINDTPTRFVVDTGATGIVLTRAAAEGAGVDLENLPFFKTADTANGTVKTAPVILDEVALGPFFDRRVRAYVNSGEMQTSLLGMEYLARFQRLEISGGRMVLER
jgi:aspartyl protease family protein